MSQTYATRQRKTPSRTVPVRPTGFAAETTLGGQSVLSGGMGSQLDEQMQAKIQQHFLNNQIPQAEREADRLSAGLNARTPDEVKERLGERLGADFSNIRFHTDSGAAKAADGIGARAYATGGDIYFGQGGFDPHVAAHELVHTVQQGLVASSTPTVSAPTGQVQMMPGFLKKLGSSLRKGAQNVSNAIVEADDTVTGKIKGAAKWLWRKTGGKLQRDNHDAMIELHEAIQNGEWDQLDEKEKKAWIRRNPIAYRRYMKSDEVKAQTEARIQKRQEEQAKAAEFLQNMGPVHSSALGDGDQPGADPVELSAKGAKDSTLDTISNATGLASDYPGDLLGLAKDSLGDGLAKKVTGGLSAGLSLPNDLVGAFQSGKESINAFTHGKIGAGFGSLAETVGNLSSGTSNLNTFLGAVGGPSSDVLGGSAGAIAGFIGAGKGIYDAQKGFRQRAAMGKFIQEEFAGKGRDELEGDDLLYRDMAALGKMQGTKLGVEGVSQAATGLIDATSGILDATAVGGVAGATLHGVSTAAKMGTKIYSAYQSDRMKKKVTEQTTGITDDKIKEFMKVSGIKNFSRAKQALMKSLGYETGQRAELFADQTEKRSQRLAQDAAGNNARAVRLAQGMGVSADKNGNYDEGALFAAMGGQKSRSQIASKKFGIRALLADKRRRQNPAASGTGA